MQAIFSFYGVVDISQVSLWKTFFTCNVLTEKKKDNKPEQRLGKVLWHMDILESV